jgi:catechol 2,3-dioxygenase-like lactoylglutathione lyase family enzyme
MSEPILGIDHVQVAAPDGCERAARGFYGSLLGLEEIDKPPLLRARGGVWFRVGAQEMHFGIAEPFAPATKAHPAFRVASAGDLELLAAQFEASGVAVQWADEAEIPGAIRFFVADPWGNRVELVTSREAS